MLQTLPSRQAALVRALSDALEYAPMLGPLLRVEQHIESEIRASIAGAPHGHLAAAVTAEEIAHLQDELLKSLEAVADATTATPAERLLANEVGDAVHFVAAMLRRYDAVLQNPPFSQPVPDTKPYLKAAYPWMPTKDSNLFAAFAGRGLELCQPGTGYVGAVMSRRRNVPQDVRGVAARRTPRPPPRDTRRPRQRRDGGARRDRCLRPPPRWLARGTGGSDHPRGIRQLNEASKVHSPTKGNRSPGRTSGRYRRRPARTT